MRVIRKPRCQTGCLNAAERRDALEQVPDAGSGRDDHHQQYQYRDRGPYQLSERTLVKIVGSRPVRTAVGKHRIEHHSDDKDAADDANTECDFM